METAEDQLAKRAGSAAFKAFGHWNAINTQAGGDVLRWADIMALPYEYVLTKLIMNKTQAAFEKRYQELSSARREKNKAEPRPRSRLTVKE